MTAHKAARGTGLDGLRAAINDHAAALDAIIADLATFKTKVNQVIVDVQSNDTEIVAAVADLLALDTAFDTLIAKMNLDGGITDVDYAASLSAMTAAAPGAPTGSSVGVLTAAALDGDTIV